MRNWGARLRLDNALGSHRALVLENETLRVTLLPDRGGDVAEFLHKPTDTDFCTFTARDLRRPEALAGLGFMDSYYGGWQEIFPSGGVACRYAGADLDQHAEVALLPWDVTVLRDDPDGVAVALDVRCLRTPLSLRRELRLGRREPLLEVRSTALAHGPRPQPVMWGQHLAFGAPAVGPGAEIELPPDCRVVDYPGTLPLEVLRSAPAPGDPSTVCYLTGFREGRYRLRDARRPVGIQVRWDASILPYLWCWREAGAGLEFPWYGQDWIIGLEPFSSYPTDGGLALAAEMGTTLILEPARPLTVEWSAQIVP